MKKVMQQLTSLVLSSILVLGLCPLSAFARTTQPIELARWEFLHDVDQWYHWESNYNGSPVSLSCSNKRLKAKVDFSKDGDSASAQVAVGYWHEGFKASRANRITIELLFEQEKLDGSFTVQATSTVGVDGSAVVSAADGRDAGDSLARTTVVIDFPTLRSEAEMKDLTLHFFGNRTTYSGYLYVERVSLWSTDGKDTHLDNALDSSYVNASLLPGDNGLRTINRDGLITTTPQGASEVTKLDNGTIRLVDPLADTNVQNLYLYLKAVGESSSVIFGQEENTWSKAGSPTLSWSDTMDLTGSYSGIVGLDTMTLTSEYPVALHNNRFGTNYKDTAEDRLKACIGVCNWSIDQGAIITLSTHMPNFTKVKPGNQSTSYAGYDFTPGTSYDMENDPVHAILPGGAYNQAYKTYLGLIATFAKGVKGPILFRPLPENPGDWIWWGTAGCDADSYRQLYRYTVEVLRDEKRVHNLLYVYSPSGDISSSSEYAARYPGDAYVDILGFGLYHKDRAEGDGWMNKLQNTAELVDQFAAEHNKLMAATEIGVSSTQPFEGSASAALQLEGNAYQDWFQDVLNVLSPTHASYFMTWKNSFRNGFYTPFAAYRNGDGSIRGHELMDNFIQFFNDPRSIFACNQMGLLEKSFPKVSVLAAVEPGGIVDTVIDSATIRRLAERAGAGNQVVLDPKDKVQIDPIGSRLTVKASDMAILEDAGNSLRIQGPVADIVLTSEGVRSLGEMDGTICFAVQQEKNTVDVSVLAGDTRLTYIPGGIQAVIHTKVSSSAKVQLVTARTAFPYGNPLEALLGASGVATWTPDGRYTASMEVKNNQITAWSITDQKGKALLSGSGLGSGTIEIDGGKTFQWTMEGSTLNWSITDNGKTVFTGSAEMDMESGQLQSLANDSNDETIKDGRYTASMTVKDGKVSSWSWSGAPAGSGLSASVQIDREPVQTSVNSDGSVMTVSLTGSAKLRISD